LPNAIPSAITTFTPVEPDNNSVKKLFEAYKGSWTDREYNFMQCMFCHASIDIDFQESTENSTDMDNVNVYLTFYDGIKIDRVVDASSQVKLNKDGVGEFVIYEEMSGFEGKGEIRLQHDQIVVNLTLNGGPAKALEVFKSQRTFIRNPYELVTLTEPIELAKHSCGNCNKFIMKLELGVEWHEDLLSGKYLEVVNAWYENEKIVRRFIVNTV
jgi:hypothetical protein